MSFRDIFDETRRKIGGAIGNQVDNFRVGLNLKQPKNLPLSLAQDAFKLQSARRVLGKEGLGSAAGIREAGKGILRTAVTGLDTARKLQPGYYIQPQRSKIQQNQFRDNMLKRLAPRGNEVQRALNKGFEFSSQMASYGPIEGATLKVASKVVPRLLASKGGQFATRRIADVLSGQAMASQQDIKNAGGGIKGRAVIAGMDILGGTAMEGAGRIARPIAKIGEQKINLAKNVSKMGKELPSKVKVGENAFSYNRGGKTLEVPNEVAEFYIKNGRMPTKTDILPKNYKFKGTTELRFQDGKFHGWDSDNDLFKAKIAQEAPSIGLSTKDISGSDALKNEARKGDYHILVNKEGGGSEFVKVEGAKPVPNNAGLDLFVSKNKDGLWVVSEAKSGKALTSTYQTRTGAVDAIDGTLARAKERGYDINKTIDESVSQYGTSPRYKTTTPQSDVIKQATEARKARLQKDGFVDPVTDSLSPQSTQGAGITPKTGATTPPIEVSTQKGIRIPLKDEKATEWLTTSVPPAGKGIERGFSKTIKTTKGLPEEIQNLKSTYTPITNEATLKAAKTQLDVEKFVKTNYDQAKKRVLSGEMTAENNALGQELIRRNIDAGKFDEVDEIFNKMAEKGTLAGQYNQAFAMWSKTTPEGMLKYAKSTVDKANSQLGSVSKALRGVFGKQMPKIDEADAKFITSQMKKAQGLPEAQRIPLIQSVMDRINKKIPWGVSDVIDTYRYNNMLSNPLTHLRNAVSNLQQTFITRPATLLGQGKVKDTVKYEIGTLKALPDAVDGFVKAMKKPGQLGRLDEPMRLKPRLLGRWNTPSDLMEAGDVFFRKLIESGEKSRGTTAKEASEIAEYSLFRAPLNAKQQGVLLNKIDDVTKATYNLRKVGLGWFIPFIRTPMNVAKQWIEYSPAGFSTMVGAGNKGEQAAKATVGSLITLAGANLALQGRTTWDAPVDPKEKELFYASGRKPFSVKVGDKWVPMQTFGAFAFALGLPAAAKYYQTESRTALTDDDISKWTKIATSGLNFWSGQTFVQGLGNFVDLVQGDQDWKLSRLLAQPITQLKPMTGALSYIARLTDPVFRKASGFGDQLKQGVPGLTKGMKAYTNPLGEESRRNITDFVAPYSMGQEDTRFEQPYKERQKTLQENNLINQLKEQGKSGTAPSGRTVVQIGNEFKEFDTEQEANFAIAKDEFKNSGKKSQLKDGIYYYRNKKGDVLTMTEDEYKDKLRNAKMNVAYNKKDYNTWIKLAEEKLNDIEKQYADADELTQASLLNQYQDLVSKIKKYQSYGGFTRGRSKKVGGITLPIATTKKVGGITLPIATPKIPIRQAKAPIFKNVTPTPKIAIKTTRPKMISKSTLASLR